MGAKFSSHVVKINPVMLRLGWAHIAVAGKEGACTHGSGRFVAFVEGEVELIPSVLDAGNLIAVDRVAHDPEVDGP